MNVGVRGSARRLGPMRNTAGWVLAISLVAPVAGANLEFTSREFDDLVFPSRREIRAEVTGSDGVAYAPHRAPDVVALGGAVDDPLAIWREHRGDVVSRRRDEFARLRPIGASDAPIFSL